MTGTLLANFSGTRVFYPSSIFLLMCFFKGKSANTKKEAGEKGNDYQDDDDPDPAGNGTTDSFVDANKAFDGNSGVTCGTTMTA